MPTTNNPNNSPTSATPNHDENQSDNEQQTTIIIIEEQQIIVEQQQKQPLTGGDLNNNNLEPSDPQSLSKESTTAMESSSSIIVTCNTTTTDEEHSSTSPTTTTPPTTQQQSLFTIFDKTSSVNLNPLPSSLQKKSKRPERKRPSSGRVSELFKTADSFLEQHVEITVKDFVVTKKMEQCTTEEEEPSVTTNTKPMTMKPQPMFMMNQSMLDGIKLKKSATLTPTIFKKTIFEENESSKTKENESTTITPSSGTNSSTVQAPPWANALKKSSSTTIEPTTPTPTASVKMLFVEKKSGGGDDLNSPSTPGKLKPTIFGSANSSTLPSRFSISKFKKDVVEEANRDETNTESSVVDEPKAAQETKTEERTEEIKTSEEGSQVVEDNKKEEPKNDISPVLSPRKAQSFGFPTLKSPIMELKSSSSSSSIIKDNDSLDVVVSPRITTTGSFQDKISMLEKKQAAQTPTNQVDFRSVLKKRPTNQ